ncbi:hypothetical protein ACN27J_24890 [Solwaraspora sp. WMMB762]|uniref:hypothetical protein n=1 Tax=Solwaraspora sp. WMMB762 TaxID=3404120 RepID=UPI003B93C17B
MPAALLNSSVPRRQLGRELRRLRERLAGVPQTTAARGVGVVGDQAAADGAG